MSGLWYPKPLDFCRQSFALLGIECRRKELILGILILAGFGVAKMSADKGELNSVGASFSWMGHGGGGGIHHMK